MRRHLKMVHRLVKVGEVLDTLNEVCISNRPRPLQAGKATKDNMKKSKPSLITVKLPAPINDAPRKPTSKTNEKILATILNIEYSEIISY